MLRRTLLRIGTGCSSWPTSWIRTGSRCPSRRPARRRLPVRCALIQTCARSRFDLLTDATNPIDLPTRSAFHRGNRTVPIRIGCQPTDRSCPVVLALSPRTGSRRSFRPGASRRRPGLPEPLRTPSLARAPGSACAAVSGWPCPIPVGCPAQCAARAAAAGSGSGQPFRQVRRACPGQPDRREGRGRKRPRRL